MKICLSARQNNEYLQRADEIRFNYKDREAIPNCIEQYPNTFILLIYSGELENLNEADIINYNILAKNNFILGTDDLEVINWCIDHNIKFYYTEIITSYDELNIIVNLGSYYVRLGPPLFFDMNNIASTFKDVKVRVVPNVAYDDIYVHNNGIAGTWIRPEDLTIYDDYVDIVDFNIDDPQKERALFRIYLEEQKWSGDLGLLISDLNYPGVNRMLSSDLTERRLNCRQICMSHKKCHICKTSLQLANPARIENYKNAIMPKYKAPPKEE